MAQQVNRRRKFVIRTRVSRREKELLVARKRAIGARTWRDYMFELGAAQEEASSVDLSKVALVASAVVALGEGPRLMRQTAARLVSAVEEIGQLMLLNPDRADLHRVAIDGFIREAQAAVREIETAAERGELSAAPARMEIARVMKLVART